MSLSVKQLKQIADNMEDAMGERHPPFTDTAAGIIDALRELIAIKEAEPVAYQRYDCMNGVMAFSADKQELYNIHCGNAWSPISPLIIKPE